MLLNRFYIGNYEYYTKTTNGTIETERETLKISDDKQTIAILDTDVLLLATTTRYQLTNHLDSASIELDELGHIISYEEYHPFGTTSYRSGRSEAEVSLKRYKYVFKELDNETGLYYYGMRYYAPWLARFVSVDPLQFKYPELTPFQYASNRPISGIDLDGAEFVQSPKTETGGRPGFVPYTPDSPFAKELQKSKERADLQKQVKLNGEKQSRDLTIKKPEQPNTTAKQDVTHLVEDEAVPTTAGDSFVVPAMAGVVANTGAGFSEMVSTKWVMSNQGDFYQIQTKHRNNLPNVYENLNDTRVKKVAKYGNNAFLTLKDGKTVAASNSHLLSTKATASNVSFYLDALAILSSTDALQTAYAGGNKAQIEEKENEAIKNLAYGVGGYFLPILTGAVAFGEQISESEEFKNEQYRYWQNEYLHKDKSSHSGELINEMLNKYSPTQNNKVHYFNQN